MASRIAVLTTRYLSSLERLGIRAGSPLARELATTIRALIAAETLPAPADVKMPIPPAATAYVRRVGRTNLWLYFTWTTEKIFVGSVVNTPPVPPL